MPPDVVIVSHTHWDREWYRPYQAFRARLVDAVDRVLDLLVADPRWSFVLDGQAIVVEDYLEARPYRRDELAGACRAGRLSVGPWYVQPDSLLPSGEAHVRNLLEGRRTASELGAPSTVAYTPDSFGHPAQFPLLFRGFGLDAFVAWRGFGPQHDAVGPVFEWAAPDGTVVTACRLTRGYFAATGLRGPVEEDVRRMTTLVDELAADAPGLPVLLMNGFDHGLPDAGVGDVAGALAAATGATVTMGRLEDYVQRVTPALANPVRWSGELLNAGDTNLLPGVWSSRMPLKLRNRRVEAALEGWAEPWSALGAVLGAPDERPSLRAAWRALLANQAHDSIGGCSIDAVHEQMTARYDTAEELADETTRRVLERVAGLGPERRTPWSADVTVAVFNPSPHTRTDVVRLPLDPYPVLHVSTEAFDVHPFTALPGDVGFEVDGVAARAVPCERDRWAFDPSVPPLDVEFVARDVPAFGWRRFSLRRSAAAPDEVDEGREIGDEHASVRVGDDGTLAVRLGDREWAGLAALEDAGDRGDSYDFDAVDDDRGAALLDVQVARRRHASGLEAVTVERLLDVPVALDDGRTARAAATIALQVIVTARIVPGVERVDLEVVVHNDALDHRLRLLFPTGAGADEFTAATTLDAVTRPTGPRDDAGWVHPAPSTWPHQGWVEANGLTVAAPGVPEVEVTPDGVIALTLLRAVGWLARLDLRSRPVPAGPIIPTPGAQCLGPLHARVSLFAGRRPVAARAAELGLRAVVAGPAADTLAPDGRALLSVEPDDVLLGALKPAEDGEGLVLRLVNPHDDERQARVSLGFPIGEATFVRLDETPAGDAVTRDGDALRVPVPGHSVRTVRLLPQGRPT